MSLFWVLYPKGATGILLLLIIPWQILSTMRPLLINLMTVIICSTVQKMQKVTSTSPLTSMVQNPYVCEFDP